jgi:hypothetical protein
LLPPFAKTFKYSATKSIQSPGNVSKYSSCVLFIR